MVRIRQANYRKSGCEPWLLFLHPKIFQEILQKGLNEMAIFLYLLREVHSGFKIGHKNGLSDKTPALYLDNYIRPQDVTMFEPP